MKNLLQYCAMVILFVTVGTFWGCSASDPVEKQILGNWKGNPQLNEEAFQEYLKAEQIPAAAANEVKKQMEGSVYYLSFQAGGKGMFVTETDDDMYFYEFTFEVLSKEKNQVRLSVGDISPSEKLDITFNNEDQTFVATFPAGDKKAELPFQLRFKEVDEIPQEPKSKKTPAIKAKTPDKASEFE